MHLIVLCVGVLSSAYFGECTITGWTTPSLSNADGDAGALYLNEGASGTLYTFAPTFGGSATKASSNPYTIPTQTVTSFFAIDDGGLLTLSGSNVLDGDATTLAHVLTIKAVDDQSPANSATVTVTFNIVAGQFSFDSWCLYLGPYLATNGAVITNGMNSEGTNEISIDSGNTNSDFSIVSGTGVITAAKDLTPASGTSGSYKLILKGIENIGTSSTVTSTLSICMRGSSCVCSSSSGSCDSGAAHITAGLLGIFAAISMMLLK